MTKRQLLFSLLFSCFCTTIVMPISQSQATMYSVIAGSLAGAAMYDQSDTTTYFSKKLVIAGVSAFAASAIGVYCFSLITPEGRYKRALNSIETIAADDLFSRSFESTEKLKQYLQLRFPNDHYLVSGTQKLYRLFDKLCVAHELLKCAKSEQSTTTELVELCTTSQERIALLLKQYQNVLALIDIDSEEYQNQRKRYDASLYRKRLWSNEIEDSINDRSDCYSDKDAFYKEKVHSFVTSE